MPCIAIVTPNESRVKSSTCNFGKCQKERQNGGKLKEKEKLAKLLLFRADSQTLVTRKVDNQHKTAVNCYFEAYKVVSCQQQKQTHAHHCWLVTSPSTWLTVLGLRMFSLMDTMTLPSQLVSFNPNNQKRPHNLLITLQLDQQCLWFVFSKMFKIVQNYSDLSHASSGARNWRKCSESCFLIFLKEQGTGKWGPKGKETKENRNSLKENATKRWCVFGKTHLPDKHCIEQTDDGRNYPKMKLRAFWGDPVGKVALNCRCCDHIKHEGPCGWVEKWCLCPRFRGGLDGQHGDANVAAGLKSFWFPAIQNVGKQRESCNIVMRVAKTTAKQNGFF